MRFRFNLAELSGALGDLGVLLPLTLALIALNGLNATGAFIGIGLAYLLSAVAYRLPIPVQPLKSFAATALALGLSARVITAGAWWMALVFIVLALTDAARRMGRLFPKPVIRGIQLGLGFFLLRGAWGLIAKPSPAWGGEVTLGALALPWTWAVALGAGLVLCLALWLRREWAALGVVLFGVALALARNGRPPLALAFTPPTLELPRAIDFGSALWLLVLPQIPLSLANAVFATADAAQQYFRAAAGRVTPRRLLTTMGVSNVASALLGGVPVCHGSGGVTAHYRLGARTGGAPLMLAVAFLFFGIIGGQTLLPSLSLIPFSALGVLLAYVGVQHALLARDLRGWREWTPAVTIALTAFYTRNLGIGFAVGAVVHFSLRLVGMESRRSQWALNGVNRR